MGSGSQCVKAVGGIGFDTHFIDGEEKCLLTPFGVVTVPQKIEDLEEHEAHVLLSHQNLAKLYHVDSGGSGLYENFEENLSSWLQKNSVTYVNSRPTGHAASVVCTTEETKKLIKGILSCVLMLHECGYCLIGDIRSEVIGVKKGIPKLSVKTKKWNSQGDRVRDLSSIAELIRNHIFKNAPNLPSDMEEFCDLLDDGRLDADKLYLLPRHFCLMSPLERIDFCSRVLSEIDSLGAAHAKNIMTAVIGYDFKLGGRDWRHLIPVRSEALAVYKFRHYNGDNWSHLTFIRNLRQHLVPQTLYDRSKNARSPYSYFRNMQLGKNAKYVDDWISALFPKSMALVQALMRTEQILETFL